MGGKGEMRRGIRRDEKRVRTWDERRNGRRGEVMARGQQVCAQ